MTLAFQPLLPGAAQLQAANGGATLVADAASFALDGQAVGLRRAARLAAESGSFAANGIPAAFKRALRLEAAPAAFAFMGGAAQFGSGAPASAKDARTLDLGLSLGL